MKFKSTLFVSAIIVLAGQHGYAREQAPMVEAGIWKGTLGNNQILVCFPRLRNISVYSQYLYYRYGEPILLSRDSDKAADIWQEGDQISPSGLWKLTEKNPRTITGIWADSKMHKTLPIRLDRYYLQPEAIVKSCEGLKGLKYLEKYLETHPSFNWGEVQTRAGVTYQEISALGGAIRSFKLFGDSPGLTEINNGLKQAMLTDMAANLECLADAGSKEGKWKARTSPKYKVSHYLASSQVADFYCGGANSSNDIVKHQTWDLNTGQAIKLWDFISDRKNISNTDSYRPGEKLIGLITDIIEKYPSRYKNAQNCLGAEDPENEWQIGLGKNGFIFRQSFNHATQSCEDDVEVSYSALAPFLTKEGAKFVREITHRSEMKFTYME